VPDASEPFPRISQYYDKLFRQYGHDPRASDYGRPESQQIKFQVLSEAMQLANRSVLDVGCGFGDFAQHLRRRFEGVRYSGIDLCAPIIEEARRLTPDLDIRVGNILDEALTDNFDLVTANGIFYLLGEQAWPLMQTIIRRMYTLSRHGVAFNSLSSWADDKEPGEFYADPLETLAFCRTLTPWVVLRHDYHPRDFTVYLYRTKNA